MIVVTVELWPRGDKERAEPVGFMTITNDATGTRTSGNYTVRIFQKDGQRVWRLGRVENFPRLSKKLGAWDLVFWALVTLVARRTTDYFEKEERGRNG